MDIFDTAKKLGEMIADSQQMQNLKAAEQVLDNDSDATNLLEVFKQKQMEVVEATRKGENKTKLDALRKNLDEAYDNLLSNSVTNGFIEAKNEFDVMMNQIDNIMRFAITGEEQCDHEGCGGSCEGCH